VTSPAHGRRLAGPRLLDNLWPVASVALSSAVQIGVALLLILVLLPAALGAIGVAAP
jgi:hypothetical protein